MKCCTTCGIEKTLSDFNKDKNLKDGHAYCCKDCVRIYKKKYREKNLDKLKEYDRRRANLPHREQARKLYAETEKGKHVGRKSVDRWSMLNEVKIKAQDKLHKAVASGKIQRKPCSICGDLRAQGHHEDYTKPLEVVWYCQKHHSLRHKELREMRAIRQVN